MENYKDLIVWQKSILLVELLYKSTQDLPKNELYGLTSQMRRAGVSIPSNIAEGFRRRYLNEYIRFLIIADASAAELETQIIITNKLYSEIDFDKVSSVLLEVQKMLATLIHKLKLSR